MKTTPWENSWNTYSTKYTIIKHYCIFNPFVPQHPLSRLPRKLCWPAFCTTKREAGPLLLGAAQNNWTNLFNRGCLVYEIRPITKPIHACHWQPTVYLRDLNRNYSHYTLNSCLLDSACWPKNNDTLKDSNTDALENMGKETDKVGPCIALTIMFFMISFTFTVMVYLIQAKDLLTEIVVFCLWPVTGFLAILTFIAYIYRSSHSIFVLEGYRVHLRRKAELKRLAKNHEEKLKITRGNPWILVKCTKPDAPVNPVLRAFTIIQLKDCESVVWVISMTLIISTIHIVYIKVVYLYISCLSTDSRSASAIDRCLLPGPLSLSTIYCIQRQPLIILKGLLHCYNKGMTTSLRIRN